MNKKEFSFLKEFWDN